MRIARNVGVPVAVLRSQVAVEASVRIMRAFVEMRHFIADNAAMFERVRAMEPTSSPRSATARWSRSGPPRTQLSRRDGQTFNVQYILARLDG